VSLSADITVPESSPGIVLFAHGNGSSRLSPRNRAVAEQLHSAGLGIVLVDLLTEREALQDAATAEYRFNVRLLGERLTAITDWLSEHETTSGRGIGLFGASTGAAAALFTAAARPVWVQAVVSRGGRPDLAGDALRQIHQPTLLIVGERDTDVLNLNKFAMAKLGGPSRLEIVPWRNAPLRRAGRPRPGRELATNWFAQYLKPLPRREQQAELS
jgi:dienelactone hydrolase